VGRHADIVTDVGLLVWFDNVEESLARIERSLKSLHKKVDALKIPEADLGSLKEDVENLRDIAQPEE
jgi:hypothetical protein